MAYAWEKEPIAPDVPKLPPFPTLDSERLAEEALELYWMALLRDVQLWDYERSSLVRDAVAELRRTKTFANVTPQMLFRLGTPGEGEGHWISQFLWMPVPYGAQNQWQQYRVAMPPTTGLPRANQRADATGMGVVALSRGPPASGSG